MASSDFGEGECRVEEVWEEGAEIGVCRELARCVELLADELVWIGLTFFELAFFELALCELCWHGIPLCFGRLGERLIDRLRRRSGCQ